VLCRLLGGVHRRLFEYDTNPGVGPHQPSVGPRTRLSRFRASFRSPTIAQFSRKCWSVRTRSERRRDAVRSSTSNSGGASRSLPWAQPSRQRCGNVQIAIRGCFTAPVGSSRSAPGRRNDVAGAFRLRSGQCHHRCLGRSHQGSAARSSRSRSGWRHSRRWASSSASGRRYIRCLGRSQTRQCWGASSSRSGWCHDRRWVVQTGLREGNIRCLGRSQQGSAAGASGSRSGQCQDRCCGVRCAPVDARGGVRAPGCRSERRQDRCSGVAVSGRAPVSATTPPKSIGRAHARRDRPGSDQLIQQNLGAPRKARSASSPASSFTLAPDSQVGAPVGLTTGVKLQGPEGAQRPRALSASTA
jgi:hypothetical protein